MCLCICGLTDITINLCKIIVMVQTRSKYRLLQHNIAGAPAEEPAQPPSTTSKEEKNKKKKKSIRQTLQSSLSPPLGLPTVHPSEAVDGTSNTRDEEQEHFNIPSSTPHQQSFNSSESEDETFDNNLHLEQQKLIDVYNREDNEEKNLEFNDLNIGANATEINLSQSPHSWTIEKNNLKWTKTNKNKDCLIIGDFSYIYMSESEKKNKLNFRCQRRDVKCGAVIHLDLGTRSFIGTNRINHNHPPDKIAMKQKI
jgi:hypothetical protein